MSLRTREATFQPKTTNLPDDPLTTSLLYLTRSELDLVQFVNRQFARQTSTGQLKSQPYHLIHSFEAWTLFPHLHSDVRGGEKKARENEW